MIHYHGTPISGNDVQAVNFMKGRHCLVSFYNKQNINIVAEMCQSFVLDNGAFSKWQNAMKLKANGVEITVIDSDVDVHDYIDWVLQWSSHPGFDWCLIPDKIDGTEEQNLELVQQWLRIAPKAKGVPVWHLHESLDYLNWLVKNFDTVALGSSGEFSKPNTSKWWDRMSEVMNTACDDKGRPHCKLHGLRMLDPDVFTRLPLSSADSTNAGVNAGSLSRFGSYLPPTAAQRAEIIAERIEAHNSSPVWVGHDQGDLF